MQCYSYYLRNVDGEVVCSCGEHREGNLLVNTLARNVFIHLGSNFLIKKTCLMKLVDLVKEYL